jgi:hypothetical protein
MNNPHNKQNHKGAITSALLLGSFLFSFIPLLFVIILKQVFDGLKLQTTSILVSYPAFAETLLLLNSFLNPIIYGLRTREFEIFF